MSRKTKKIMLAFACLEVEELVKSLSTGNLGKNERSLEKMDELVFIIKRTIFFSRFQVCEVKRPKATTANPIYKMDLRPPIIWKYSPIICFPFINKKGYLGFISRSRLICSRFDSYLSSLYRTLHNYRNCHNCSHSCCTLHSHHSFHYIHLHNYHTHYTFLNTYIKII
jgi:hypothetical protein